jgi:Protein of unknown function DUF72
MSAEIRLGTSAFSANGWAGAFYPKGMKTADHLYFYSTRFDTVEVDSTFCRRPTIEAVNNWALKTPPGFIFCLKIPLTTDRTPPVPLRAEHPAVFWPAIPLKMQGTTKTLEINRMWCS